jgi:hypothetical protein
MQLTQINQAQAQEFDSFIGMQSLPYPVKHKTSLLFFPPWQSFLGFTKPACKVRISLTYKHISSHFSSNVTLLTRSVMPNNISFILL